MEGLLSASTCSASGFVWMPQIQQLILFFPGGETLFHPFIQTSRGGFAQIIPVNHGIGRQTKQLINQRVDESWGASRSHCYHLWESHVLPVSLKSWIHILQGIASSWTNRRCFIRQPLFLQLSFQKMLTVWSESVEWPLVQITVCHFGKQNLFSILWSHQANRYRIVTVYAVT